jgi:hypothetical protein
MVKQHRTEYEPLVETEAAVVTTSAAPTPMTVSQDDTHKQTVTAAAGTKQSAIQAAVTTYKGGGTLAALQSAVKSADVAYHRAIIASALATSQPFPLGSLEALRNLGLAA